VNTSKSKFFVEQIEYLGYWITKLGIQLLSNKFKAIINIKSTKKKKRIAAIPIYWYSQLLSQLFRLDIDNLKIHEEEEEEATRLLSG
jgi:hypothetical protein